MLGYPRRKFLAQIAAAVTTLAPASRLWGQQPDPKSSKGELPTTGVKDFHLDSLDQLMTSFVSERQMPGAALAVTKDSRLVYARGFGYADVEKKVPAQPAALFRIASVSKPITATAVMQLVERGKLRLEDKAFEILKLRPYVEPGDGVDPRLHDITVHQLLQHTAGWDRDKSFDPIGRPWEIAKSLKVRPPIRPEQVVRYMMGKPLDFDPGQRHAYSNLGYLVLGRIIEMVSHQPYQTYVRQEVLAPLGITTARLGKGALQGRAPDEVKYYDSKHRTGPAVVGPNIGKTVPLPDGAENLDGFEAHGGWIASAVDLVRFASAFDRPADCKILNKESLRITSARPPGLAGHEPDGKPLAAFYGCGWSVRPIGKRPGKANMWHTGLIAGTSTLLVRRWDGFNWAVLFNIDAQPDGKQPAGEIDSLMHQAVDRVKKWPDSDLFSTYIKS
jgi:N-acyl-D-amino-acid deacylase